MKRALRETVEITLIESSSVNIIGVGEATIPTYQETMEFIGYKEEEWLPHVNGTFKAAIQFVDWVDAPQPGQDSYYRHAFPDYPDPLAQPFGNPWFVSIGEGASLIHYCLPKRLNGEKRSIAEMMCPATTLCERLKSPKSHDDSTLSARYAFHMDAGLIGGFLRERLTKRGVKHIVDHLVDVELDEKGFIRNVKTENGRQLGADLFIDCTGFRGLLINKAMRVPYVSDNGSLFCNAAVAIPCRNNPEVEGINPYVPIVPMRGEFVRRAADIVADVLRRFGLNIPISFFGDGRSLVTIQFRADDPRQVTLAEQSEAALWDEMVAACFPPNRVGVDQMQRLVELDADYFDLISKLKSHFDPNHVISPGRYCPV